MTMYEDSIETDMNIITLIEYPHLRGCQQLSGFPPTSLQIPLATGYSDWLDFDPHVTCMGVLRVCCGSQPGILYIYINKNRWVGGPFQSKSAT